MALYYVNNQAQSNGDHEVHEFGCTYMPSDRTYLGDFQSCREAVQKAKQRYRQSNGCFYCSRECHTT